MNLSQRSNQLEWIDLGPSYYTQEEYNEALYQLHRIGRFLGGNRATVSTFQSLPFVPQSILDVGCGGGLFTTQLANLFPEAKVLGIDTNPQAIEFARKQIQKTPSISNVTFDTPSTPQLDYPSKEFDVITSTLVCHHLTDDELIDFFKRSYRIAKKAIIMNDLHRNFPAYVGFKLIAPFLFPNRLIIHDGLLSIRRSFRKQDWILYLEAAEIPLNRCHISWHWAFRWIVYINTFEGQQ